VTDSTTSGPEKQDQTGTLHVHTVLADEAGTVLQFLEAGVLIRVNGANAGVTDATGALTISQPEGTYQVEALLSSIAKGSASVQVTAGATTEAVIRLIEGESDIGAGVLRLDELVNGSLPLDATTLTLRFRQGPAPDATMISLSSVSRVEASSPVIGGAIFTDFIDRFSVSSGAITASGADAAEVMATLAILSNDVELLVQASDANGLSYQDVIVFGTGVYRIEGQLAAPPSKPDLSLAGVTVTAESANRAQTEVTSDAAGRFALEDQPSGMTVVGASTTVGATVYASSAHIALDQDKQLVLRLLTTADIRAGVADYQVSDIQQAQPSATHRSRNRARSASPIAGDEGAGAPAGVTAADAEQTVTVTATSDIGDQPVTAHDTLTVAQDTMSVVLEYEVFTAEYPQYVLDPDNRYNDTWDLLVADANRSTLFSIGREINSQVFGAPSWNATGSTGKLQQTLDVGDLTIDGDIELLLRARATNIGDSHLSTRVTATLGAVERFFIEHVEQDTGKGNDSRLFSIPGPGERNVFQRSVIVTYHKPGTVQLTKVKVELLDVFGEPVQTVLDEGIDGVHVNQLSDTQLAAQVTFSPGTTSSEVESPPPPYDRIGYRVVLTGLNEDGEEITTDPKDATNLIALWRMPEGLARYSVRSLGGDDWCRKFTYSWLEDNRLLVTAINDISKEHGGRFRPHDSHRYGFDIDMFHPLPVLPSGSGTQNYEALAKVARRALQGDQQAVTFLHGWMAYTRQWLDALLDDNDVIKLGYMNGAQDLFSATTALRGGWARELLATGTYFGPLPTGGTIDLALGPWTNANNTKLFFDDVHNNHVHVKLRPLAR
jgi:hypothetical protein